MAAPVRRPQFLLPWIAICTVVLGAGLQTFAPERSRRGTAGAAANRVPDAQTVPLPARLEPLAPSFLVRDPEAEAREMGREAEADPNRPHLLHPSEAPTPGVGAGVESALAGREGPGAKTNEERRAARTVPAPAAGGVERPALRPSAAAEGAASLANLLPAPGAILRWRWSGDLITGPNDGADASPAAAPELVILRVSDDAFRAFLVLDEATPPDPKPDDPADPASGEPRTQSGEETAAPDDPAATAGQATRERWARWFAAQAPRRAPAAAPQSREELRTLLERTLGEHKVRYLVAASRDLDAREAAELLGRVRRWMIDQRAG